MKLSRLVAHLNPHRHGCNSPTRAKPVAWHFCSSSRDTTSAEHKPTFEGNAEAESFLDLVALGNGSRSAPLTELNRALVRYGLEVMRRKPLGVRACSGLQNEIETLDASDLGYRLGPRINAAGRLDDASRGFRPHWPSGPMARELAILVEQNRERRVIQEAMTHEALDMAQRAMAAEPTALVLQVQLGIPVVVLCLSNCEEFHVPTILLAGGGV